MKTRPNGTAIIIKMRKSRITLKDGRQLLSQAEMIKNKRPKTRVVVYTATPVCSKTKKFLKNNNIDITCQ